MLMIKIIGILIIETELALSFKMISPDFSQFSKISLTFFQLMHNFENTL